mmetsp:Transcript_18647/g.27957  ORF Transcript_18647/g.27957 Transcript_18647/m.27957 type:complete len:213 (+) Transcript_18647:3819-4457(+)
MTVNAETDEDCGTDDEAANDDNDEEEALALALSFIFFEYLSAPPAPAPLAPAPLPPISPFGFLLLLVPPLTLASPLALVFATPFVFRPCASPLEKVDSIVVGFTPSLLLLYFSDVPRTGRDVGFTSLAFFVCCTVAFGMFLLTSAAHDDDLDGCDGVDCFDGDIGAIALVAISAQWPMAGVLVLVSRSAVLFSLKCALGCGQAKSQPNTPLA